MSHDDTLHEREMIRTMIREVEGVYWSTASNILIRILGCDYDHVNNDPAKVAMVKALAGVHGLTLYKAWKAKQ